MMSFSMSMPAIWEARLTISPTLMSVLIILAISDTVFAMVTGSDASTFLAIAAITVRWFAARWKSPPP